MNNYYIVVEGKKSEKHVYPSWLSYFRPDLRQVNTPNDIEDYTYYLISGMGYPFYFEIIENAITDINDNPQIECLVISVDSEEQTLEEKKEEIYNFVKDKINLNKVKIIIQHFCLETWALGNKVIYKRNPQDRLLREYCRLHNVCINDPELLPHFPKYDLNRAQLAEDYLKKLLKEKWSHLTYNKRKPTALLNERYFLRVLQRFEETNHIRSFGMFLDAFNNT